MATAGNITAVLTLNSSGFQTGLTESIEAVTEFKNSLNTFNTTVSNNSRGLEQYRQHINAVVSAVNNMDTVNKSSLNTFSRLASAVNKMANGLKILQSDSIDVEQGVNTMNNIFKAFQGTLNGTEFKLRELSTAEKQLLATSNQIPPSESKKSASMDKTTASINRQTTASKGLKNALSSLKMMGTMVGSMIAYNFVHNLAMATTETINAKSEMNGYFQMLGYTTRQTNDFNKALDNTVKKFPRLNKYALGETISSIGVEFELTTKEMEKAMPVVSMITSEYLRAGRNVNEASLAVKDILQGEFQRLSRETGVKGDQLKEAGWSGDKTDVMGLLKALEKVGKERNWDTFVQKANSLNDAVLILQNRFSEWSADMVERVQPAIVEVFNTMMIIAQDFAKAINKALDWLSGDGIGQSIVKWGGLATAIIGVATALTVYRTGANLTQIAQMGLTKTIGATILGLEAETVAEYGLRTSLIANITHMKAEEVARQGRLNSITATITGLEAEEVAEMGKARVLASSILGLDMATVKEYGFTTALWSNVTGVEAETIAMEGWNAQMYLTVAGVGVLAGAVAVLTGALIVQAIHINETTEKYKKFVDMVEKGDDIISEAKDTVDDLTNKKSALKDKLGELTQGTSEYNEVASKLAVTQQDLTTATSNYEDAVNSVAWAKHKQELYDEEKASAQASAQREINDALVDYGLEVEEASQLSSQLWNDAKNGWDQHYETLQKVNLQYEKNAVSVQSALKKMNDAKLDPKEVSVLIRPKITAGNEVAQAKEELGNATSLTEYADKWLWLQVKQVKNAIADFDINNATEGLESAIQGLAWGVVHFFGDNFIGQFTQGLARDWGLEGVGSEFGEWLKTDIPIEKWIMDFDWSGWLQDAFRLLNNIPIDFDLLGTIWEAISSNLGSSSNSGESSSGGSGIAKKLDPSALFGDLSWITQWFDDNIKKPVIDWWNGFISFDWLPSFDFDIWSLFGFDTVSASDGSSDHPSFMEDISNIIGFDIQSWITNFNSDPLGTLGIQLPNIDIIGLITSLIPIGGEGGFDIGGWLSSIFDISGIVSTFTSNLQILFTTASSIATNVSGVFSNLKSMIWGHIQGILSNVTSTFTNIKNTAVTQINGLSQGIQGGIDKVKNAFIFMKDSILDSAKKIYDGVKAKFDSVKTTIGDFWHKLTNPSSWGSAGSESYQRRSPKPHTARKMFSPVVRGAVHHGAGVNPYQNDSQTVKLKDLMNMVNGDNKVRLSDFLAMFSEGGFGTWDFHEPVKTKVFDTAKGYKTGSPNIKGIGTVGDGYKVGKFWDGKPSFSFDEFMTVAQAIFSAIPYKFYYDSEWKGNWVNALLSGAVNCSDGADALIALANVFGLSGYKQHTTLKSGVGHFFAVIGGKPMDTTNFQNHGSWSPLGGAGIPTRTSSIGRSAVQGNTTNHTVNVTITGDVYGVDDLESRIEEGVKRGLRDEFNDPYTVAI